jgi:oligoribonuclease NrnB/cAMP/cGMP phosphodiesterase (DHH superfamily)
MSDDLEQRLTTLCESMEKAEAEYNQSTQCLVDALTTIHERFERIEKWIMTKENQAQKD